MLPPLPIVRLQLQAQRIARRAIFGAAAAVFFVIGLGFVIAAMWILLADAFGALVAACIMALIFLGGGGLIALAGSKPGARRSLPASIHTAPATPVVGLLDAFLVGLRAGKAVKQR